MAGEERRDKEEVQIKFTKVRKGMGNAKYSTLITTIPSEICKALSITERDSVTWRLDMRKREVVLTRMEPLVGDKYALMVDLPRDLIDARRTRLPARLNEMLMQARQLKDDYIRHGFKKEDEERVYAAYDKAYAEIRKYLAKEKEEKGDKV
jgi:hypothetical protein